MKTLDEALASYRKSTEKGHDAKAADQLERMAPLGEEIQANPDAISLLKQILAIRDEYFGDPMTAMLRGLIAGVFIGITMEREELPTGEPATK